jgi:hypothetical protein
VKGVVPWRVVPWRVEDGAVEGGAVFVFVFFRNGRIPCSTDLSTSQDSGFGYDGNYERWHHLSCVEGLNGSRGPRRRITLDRVLENGGSLVGLSMPDREVVRNLLRVQHEVVEIEDEEDEDEDEDEVVEIEGGDEDVEIEIEEEDDEDEPLSDMHDSPSSPFGSSDDEYQRRRFR